jgi:superfamily I DNA/RNA helicase
MKNKLYDLIGPNDVWAGTFHGLSKNLLTKYSPKSIQSLYFIDELVSMGEQWLQTEDGRKWVSKIRYIFVDEFQDINISQWKMILRIFHIGSRLIVVGDDCQNIYTWRGSNVNFILDLNKEVKTPTLTTGLVGSPKVVNISIEKYLQEFNKTSFIDINEGLSKTIKWNKNIN